MATELFSFADVLNLRIADTVIFDVITKCDVYNLKLYVPAATLDLSILHSFPLFVDE